MYCLQRRELNDDKFIFTHVDLEILVNFHCLGWAGTTSSKQQYCVAQKTPALTIVIFITTPLAAMSQHGYFNMAFLTMTLLFILSTALFYNAPDLFFLEKEIQILD